MKQYLKRLLETFRAEYDNERPRLEADYEKNRFRVDPSKSIDLDEIKKQEHKALQCTFKKIERKWEPLLNLGMSPRSILDLEKQVDNLWFTTPDKPGCLSWEQIKQFVGFFPFSDDAKYYAHLKTCQDCRLKVYKGMHNPPWEKPCGV